MVLGSPARVVRKLTEEERASLKNWADKCGQRLLLS